MATVTINGITIHYEEMGRGTPVVLTPGGRSGMEAVRPLAERIAHEHRVIIYDRRNCGASDVLIEGEPSEQEIWADDLTELLRKLDAAPAYVGGGSAGCRVSLLLAIRHPQVVKALLLWQVTGGAVAAERLGYNYYDSFVEVAEKEGMEGVSRTPFFAERIQQNPSNRDRLLAMDAQGFIKVMRRWRTFFTADKPVIGATEEELRRIAVPTVIIAGNDEVHPTPVAENLHRILPDSEYHPTPWTSEEQGPERAEKIGRIFLDFVRKVEGRVPAGS